MSFVAGFYSFNLHLANAAAGSYADVRIKTPRHPDEPLQHLYARVIAFAHAYRPGQEFSQGWYEPKDPAIWARDIIGDLTLWLEIGAPDEDKLRRTLRRHASAEKRIYFTRRSEIDRFCVYLRGSTTNWAAGIDFYLIDEMLLETLLPLERANSDWQLTFVDDVLYLTVDEVQLESSVRPVSIWEEFQASLEAKPG